MNRQLVSVSNLMKTLFNCVWLLIIGLNYTNGSTVWANQPDARVVVLGVAQDAGYPQAGCFEEHCMPGWQDKTKRITPTSLALIDHVTKTRFLFEATPQLPEQLYRLEKYAGAEQYSLNGVFLTHAHIGHYSGLMFFGHEAMGAKNVPVFVMPRMKVFLQQNGPWSQLVNYRNISLQDLANNKTVNREAFQITPFLVPHRDEFSETVGYRIQGPEKSLVFIPDINKWQQWEESLVDLVKSVDYAFLDAAFYADGELPGRDMSVIPHPFVSESMAILDELPKSQKTKVWFIHMNHTNPLLHKNSREYKHVQQKGYNIAFEGLELKL